MKTGYLKGTASFMIALILSLPIYSSFVLAILSNGYIYGGTDKVRGYTRRSEDISLNVTAWISGDSKINASQLHITNDRGPIFDACNEKTGGSYYCTYKMNKGFITQNPYQVRVALYNDNNIFDSLLILHGAFDEQAPEIRSFSISPSIIAGGNINFQYNLYDHSYSPTDTNRCSGINKIELSRNGVILNTTIINSPPNDCSVSGTIAIPVSKINDLQEGTVEVTLTAYDNFNLMSTATAQFEYDTQAVFIPLDSLEIKDSNEKGIDYIGDKAVSGVISFIVASNDLNVNNVYGDISKININHIPSYNNKKATCITYEEGYKCSFTNIEVKLSQSSAGAIPITINAYDKAGNVERTVLTKVITYDAIGPSVTAIKTDKEDNGIYYAGSSTKFTVELNEEGIGIDKNNIILDLSNIKSGLKKAADECTNSGSQWTCYWNNIIPDQSDGEKTISVEGSDKLGNKVTGTSAKVTIDKTPPKVISSEVNAVGFGAEAIEGYIKTGDTLDITLNIKEKNKLRAYADFSSFVTTQNNISASCTKKGEDDWTCELRSEPIDVPGHRIGNINFNLVDVAGNNILYKEPIEVLEYEDATDVSYWTSKVICSPALVDRQITNLVNARVYCSITLNPVTPDEETLSLSLNPNSCTDNYNNSLGYIENIELINAERGSTEPYLSIDLIKGEMTISKLGFTCPLQIISRAGYKINQNPEIERIKVDINFYNMPLGEYGEGIESKIKDAKDDAFGGIWKLVGTLKKLMSYAKLICNVLQMLQNVKRVFEVFTAKVTTAHLAALGPPQEPILAAVKTGSCVGDETIGRLAEKSYLIGDKLCKFVNCQLSPKPPDSDKGGGGKEGSWFKGIEESIGSWTYQGNELLGQAPGGGQMAKILSFGKAGSWEGEGTITEYFGKQPYQYMNARDNLLVAIALGCIPGIINGLDKYRQILCLYADCLEQNAYNNVPVKICEEQKSYATCKYIFGEIFAVLPYTALFDYYIGMIRSALSDPITAIVSVYNVWKSPCIPRCDPSKEASAYWLENEKLCRFLQFFSLLGEVINDVNGIIDDYEQIKGDYCARLKKD